MKIKIDERDSLILRILYNTFIGRIILWVITRVTFSKIIALFLNSRLSRIVIKPFIKKNNIDNSIYEEVNYLSFNNYFIRKKKNEYINIDKDKNVFISPCDCKLTIYEANNNIFKIKHVEYDLESLLEDKSLASEYKDSYVIICRLTPDDYHRYVYVDDGDHEENKKIKGILHTVRPIAIGKRKVFIINSRSYTILNTSNFGKVVQVEVGALMVGKIVNINSKCNFKKGEEKGYFEYGGSTIILLVQKDNVIIDNYLLNNTKRGYETIIKMGNRIGIKKKRS